MNILFWVWRIFTGMLGVFGFFRRHWLLLVVCAAAFSAAVIFTNVLVDMTQSGSPPVAGNGSQTVDKPQAKPSVLSQPTPCVPPPGFSKCPEPVRPSTSDSFDWGEGPKIDFGGLRPQLPTPTPIPEPPFWEKVKTIPVVGAPVGLIFTIFGVIDWVIRNLWLVIILALVVALLTRMPIWMPFLIVWEVIQTLFSKETVKDAWKKHKKNFSPQDKQDGGNRGRAQSPRGDQQ